MGLDLLYSYNYQDKKFFDGKLTLDYYYDNDLIPYLTAKGFKECVKRGYILFCKPCPFHQSDQNDSYYIDLLDKKSIVRCTKEPLIERESEYLTLQQIVSLRNFAKEINRKEIVRSQIEIIARHYLSINYVISIKQNEKYAVFVYKPEKGKYDLAGREILRGEIQQIFSTLFPKENMPETLSTSVYFEIAELSAKGSDLSVFEHDDGTVYYIPTIDKDIEVNRDNGNIQILEKDPINRPSLIALPYRISNIDSTEMPLELQELLTLVPPSFRETLLFELVSPLAFMGTRRIYVNFSRYGGTGKSTLLRRIEELYGDLVVWTEANALDGRFEKSAFIGKSAILIDEYDGGGLRTKREFKMLASGNSLRVEIKNGPILNIKNRLSIILNTNSLRFDETDQALHKRLIIIPFIKNFNTDKPVKPWDEETRKRILKWLIKNVLPRYFTKEPKRYPLENIAKWLSSAKLGEHPYDGIEEFLDKLCYKGEEKHGVLVSLEKAFNYYLLWTDMVDYIPVSYQEFVDKLRIIHNRDKVWLIQKGDGLKLCMKKANLAFFI